MNSITYNAFGQELVKIAMMGAIGRGFKAALGEGWKAHGGWMGTGKYTSKLPIGGKTIATGLAAAGAPGALKKEDPTGQGRTRTERTLDLAGNVLGGIAGMGGGRLLGGRLAGAAKLGPKMTGALKTVGEVAGGVGGGLIAPRILTAPSRALRARRPPPVQEQPADAMSGYGS